MIIKKIILENYGLYAGEIEFDLAPRSQDGQKRNIVLIGGKNGFGKTTFLNALRIALYGKAALGKRVSQSEYEVFLRNQIHQNKDSHLKNNSSRLAVEFEYVALGKHKNYKIERSWKVEGKGIKEFLKIYSDGQLEEDVSDDYWKGFIEEIIPERLSQLFFFDGEKIQEIADETSENMVLAEAIKTLLGLDVVDRLKADLSIYKSREIKNSSLSNFNKQSDEINLIIKKLVDQIANGEEDLAQLETQIFGNSGDINKWEKRLSAEGGHFASLRNANKEDKNKLHKRIVEFEDRIKEECIDIFPFSLCPTINNLLRDQIRREADLSHHQLVKKEIQRFELELLTRLETVKSINNSDKKEIEKIISKAADNILGDPENSSAVDSFLGFSDSLAGEVLRIIDSAEIVSLQTVKKFSIKLEEAYKRLRVITKELFKSPDESQVKSLFEELAVLNQRQGKLQQRKKQLEESIKSSRYELHKYQSSLNKLIEKQKVHEQSQERLEMVKKIDSILELYYKELKDVKIDQLNQSFSDGFNKLMSKKLIDRIRIDPETFNVSLFDGSGEFVSREAFSSGEKQLYAIAMLWSLAKTSGRPLPVIIDTPLGRLDSHHRKNLVENYYPMASHQVILLSTDTEIDKILHSDLNPYLSHCYELKFDSRNRCTRPVEGYFWKEEKICLS